MEHTIGIGQFRADTCNYLDRVASGETIRVIRRGHPAVRIESAYAPWLCALPGDSTNTGQRLSVPVNLSYLRRCAAQCFDLVAAGQTIEIVRRGEAVARIVGFAGSSGASTRDRERACG